MQYPIKEYLRAFRDRITYGLRGRWDTLWAYLQRQPRWKLVGATIGVPLLLGSIFALSLYIGLQLGWFGPLPTTAELKKISNNQASSVYSDDGVIIGKYFIENRVNVDLEDITPYLRTGLIATEDSRFFEHGGVDLRALLRVAFKSVLLRDESSGGGSTISQQLAKNLYPRRSYAWFGMLKNKAWEMATASRLEETYTKDELLELYLNTVPFGENIYGVKVAAQRFFNRLPGELRPEQAAVLIGILKGNTLYNPRRNPKNALDRRNTVLNRMQSVGLLDTLSLDSLAALPLTLDYQPEGENQGPATYFREHLRREILAILAEHPDENGRVYDLYRDGLKIYTSIDSRIQQHAEAAIAEQMPALQDNLAEDWKNAKAEPWEDQLQEQVKRSPIYLKLTGMGLSHEAALEKMSTPSAMTIFDWKRGGAVDTTLTSLDSLRHYFTLLNAGLLAAEPATGVIKAWVGGIDFRFVQYDHVKSRRQVGSIIKPIVYATAIAEGMLPCEYTPAERVAYEDFNNYNPGNANGQYEGAYSMRGGISKSINTVAVNIAVRTGLEKVVSYARQLGLEAEVRPIPSLALGTVEANLLEMVRAYSAFANRGRRITRYHYLDRIETGDGKVIASFERPSRNETKYVFSDSVNALTTYLMASVINSGTAYRLRSTYGLSGALAGKTGTTQNQSDGWFLGFNPKLVAGSWVGAEYSAVHFRTLSRGSATATALPVWGDFMRRVTTDSLLGNYQGGGFQPLDEMTLALLQCPDYLEEMPILYSDSLRGDVRLREVAPETVEELMLRKPRRDDETPQEYIDRIERELEKEERKDVRRQKRKEFWGNVFFGDKKEKPDGN